MLRRQKYFPADVTFCSLHKSTAVGLELKRITPIDFESIALTARPSCLTTVFNKLRILQFGQTNYAASFEENVEF